MNEIDTIIDAFNSLNNLALENQKKILLELNSCLVECTQDLHEFNIRFEDVGLFEKLLFQIIYHNKTLLQQSDGITINVRDKEISFHDLSATYSLARLQIETFINLSYLFFIDLKHSKELRVVIYKIQGLRKHISLTVKHKKDFPPIAKMRNELAKELQKLRKLKEYQKETKKRKSELMHPRHARLSKLEEVYKLIEIGNLSRCHSLYSNHIHAEYISIRQLYSSIRNSKESENSTSTVIILLNRITSSIIKNISEQYLPEENSLNKFSAKLKTMIKMTNNVSKSMH